MYYLFLDVVKHSNNFRSKFLEIVPYFFVFIWFHAYYTICRLLKSTRKFDANVDHRIISAVYKHRKSAGTHVLMNVQNGNLKNLGIFRYD